MIKAERVGPHTLLVQITRLCNFFIPIRGFVSIYGFGELGSLSWAKSQYIESLRSGLDIPVPLPARLGF